MKKLRGEEESLSLFSTVAFGRRGWSHRPVLAEAHDAAVILITPLCIQHPGVNDMSDGDVQVIGTEVLQQLQGLVPS